MASPAAAAVPCRSWSPLTEAAWLGTRRPGPTGGGRRRWRRLSRLADAAAGGGPVVRGAFFGPVSAARGRAATNDGVAPGSGRAILSPRSPWNLVPVLPDAPWHSPALSLALPGARSPALLGSSAAPTPSRPGSSPPLLVGGSPLCGVPSRTAPRRSLAALRPLVPLAPLAPLALLALGRTALGLAASHVGRLLAVDAAPPLALHQGAAGGPAPEARRQQCRPDPAVSPAPAPASGHLLQPA